MKKILFWFFICLFFGSVTLITPAWSADENQKILRLHVLANSDNLKDQQLKLRVGDEVLRNLITLKEFNDFSQVISYLTENLVAIEKTVTQVVRENGFEYPVSVALTKSTFPTRYYLEKTYPAGEYLALKIVIGEGKGANWWCVLYPTLCFIDLEQNSEPMKVEKERIENEAVIPAISSNFQCENTREKDKKVFVKELFTQWQKVVKEMWNVSQSP